jgi:hypothetical protein
MNSSPIYVKELEMLILNTLLPVYEKHQRAAGVVNPLQGINPNLLKQIKAKKQLAALLRAQEK